MSLSRVYKPPGNVIFQDVVSIKQDRKINSHVTFVSPLVQIEELEQREERVKEDLVESSVIIDRAKQEAEKIIQKAALEAQIIVADAHRMAERQREEAKEAVYQQALHEHRISMNENLTTMIDDMSSQWTQLIDNQTMEINHMIETVENQSVQLAIAIASTILKRNIEEDPTCLKTMILEEIQKQHKLELVSVTISSQAKQLYDSISAQCSTMGIDIKSEDAPLDHVLIEGKMGYYDGSITTQLNEMKKRFKNR